MNAPSVAPSPVALLVTAGVNGQRLDQAIAALDTSLSRSRLQKLIKDGRVSINGTPVTRSATRVSTGEQITVVVPAPEPTSIQPESLDIDILHEDADIIVVNKPAGMVVHPAAGHAAGTLVNALLHHATDLSGVGGALRPGIVHRLDKGTSGVMVVAKNDRAHASLSDQFRDRTARKEYLALVWGQLEAGRQIDAAIGRDPTHRHRMSVRARRARSASTIVLTATAFQGVTFVRVAILTGRTHQIRVHLQAIGHPVVGDETYGGVHRHLPLHLRVVGTLSRPFLHAALLCFVHPTSGETVRFEAPLPDDLARVVERLRE
ncbi:MAG: RluA family pseudouridine synthase [Vicinamibacterales bacterium]